MASSRRCSRRPALLPLQAAAAAGRQVEFTDHVGQMRRLQARHVVLATGSEPMLLPGVPFDGERIVDSGSVWLRQCRLCVIGAGVKWTRTRQRVWRRLGAETVVLGALTAAADGGRPGREGKRDTSSVLASTSGSARR